MSIRKLVLILVAMMFLSFLFGGGVWAQDYCNICPSCCLNQCSGISDFFSGESCAWTGCLRQGPGNYCNLTQRADGCQMDCCHGRGLYDEP